MSLHLEFHVRLNYYLYEEADENGFRRPFITRTRKLILETLQRAKVLSCNYQLEIGETGIKHWQMHIIVKTPMNKYKLGCMMGVDRKIWEYCEPARNPAASQNYASKSETRIEGPYKFPERFSLDTIENLMKIEPSHERTKKI